MLSRRLTALMTVATLVGTTMALTAGRAALPRLRCSE